MTHLREAQEMKQGVKIVCSILTVVIIVVVPFIIDWWVGTGYIPNNITSSDWIGFLGSYIGAIIGGVVSLIGLRVTIKFTKQQMELNQDQFSEQNRLNIRPLLDFEITDVSSEADSETIIMSCGYTFDKQVVCQKAVIEFEISNIGLGAAINMKYGIEVGSTFQDGVFWGSKQCSLKSGCTMKQKLMIFFPNNMLDFNIVIFYDDIIGNHYLKHLELLNQQPNEEKRMICIVKQDNGKICNANTDYRYYVFFQTTSK